MKDKIELKIISIDGKIIEDSVDEIYFDIPLSGVTGILPNRTPFAALLHIGIFLPNFRKKKNGHWHISFPSRNTDAPQKSRNQDAQE